MYTYQQKVRSEIVSCMSHLGSPLLLVHVSDCAYIHSALAGSIGRQHLEDLRQELPSPSEILMKVHQEPENIQLGGW